YCLAVEKILGITNEIPKRAQYLRILLVELLRLSSHLICIGATAMELGAMSVFLYCLREREQILDFFEWASGAHDDQLYPHRRRRAAAARRLARRRARLRHADARTHRRVRALTYHEPALVRASHRHRQTHGRGCHRLRRDRPHTACHWRRLG